MAKVFRLFTDKDLYHWEDRGDAYGPTVIESIANPDGDFSKNEPTSIPSPFARIDLVRSAFKYVTDQKQLNGNTIYHKIISDCFDVGELFFKIDLLGSKGQIKSWDSEVDLKNLKLSKNPKHKLYGETLALFLSQDNETYNFNELNKIFFLIYDYQIIGGTSPSTLFFSSGNELSFTKIQFGNDTLFGAEAKPFHKRDPEYQKYIYHFFKAYELSDKMRELDGFLTENLNLLRKENNVLHNEIKHLESKKSNILLEELNSTYEPLDTGTPGDNLEIIGCWMKKKRIKDRGRIIQDNSDFVINSTKEINGYLPLVLQNNLSQKLIYTDPSVLWNKNTVVPYFDEETDINLRILPGQLDNYPYLTVSDFLQPQLIRLVYPIHKEKFWTGNIKVENGDKTKDFLLPLTKKFFDYFDTNQLQDTVSDGKPMLEMLVYAASVEVILRIPIKNAQYITFKREYSHKSITTAEPDLKNNKGCIIENQFGLTIYPFLKTGNDLSAHYRIMLVDRDIARETKNNSYNLAFCKNKNNELLKYTSKKTRSNKELNNATSNFFILDKEFDYIEVIHQTASGIVIPLFPPVKNGNDDFTFAIDFGTTNTHIEYTLDSKKDAKSRIITPFEIKKEDSQIASLHDPASEELIDDEGAFYLYSLIPQEFLPEVISKQSIFKFPQRTVLGHHESLDLSKSTFSLADFNIPFVYEKEPIYRGTKIHTNLKWSNYNLNDEDERKVEAFFEELILLIRNKVLMNNGKLKNTRILWFFPSSMVENRKNQLEKIWNKLFNKYINETGSTEQISESVAPFYFYKNNGGVDSSDLPVASIDIGGGTSDIVIFTANKPELSTSFKFAANAIFGDAYNGSPERNGFVLRFKEKIQKLLQDNSESDLEKVLENISHEQNSEDIIAFLFSIENNKSVIDSHIPISFNDMLTKDNELKIIFIVFYSAIIYHLAKLMKVKGHKIPAYITFSGTGSKVLGLTDSNSKLTGLQKLTNIIFRKIYASEKSDIEIMQYKEPKEITCRGGLLSDKNTDLEDLKDVLIGNTDNRLVSETSVTYDQLNDEPLLTSVVDEVNQFINLIAEINNEFNFSDKFGVNPALFKSNIEVLKKDLMRYLKSGIEIKKQDLRGKTNINLEEPLFFYPLVGALNKLAYHIIAKAD